MGVLRCIQNHAALQLLKERKSGVGTTLYIVHVCFTCYKFGLTKRDNGFPGDKLVLFQPQLLSVEWQVSQRSLIGGVVMIEGEATSSSLLKLFQLCVHVGMFI